MIRALRSSILGRQPFLPSTGTSTTTSTSTSPFQRLFAPSWRAAKKPTPIPSKRSLHSSKSGAATTAAPSAAQAQASASIRGSQAWRNLGTSTPYRLLSRTRKRNFSWSWSRRSQTNGANGGEESLSLSGRLRKLSREYGWSAVGVYLALSVLDFPFCFLLVKWAGTDRIAAIEHWVLTSVKKAIPESFQQTWHEYRAAMKTAEKEELGDNHVSEDVEKVGWGVEKAQESYRADASLATQLALAYAIHKSFIFVRVPLTAAVTPKVVKVLRSWGWQIGKRKPKTKR